MGACACSCAQGYAVLVGACFRSIPQILRILRAKSATGVSLSANISELLAYSIAVAYNVRLGAMCTWPQCKAWSLIRQHCCSVVCQHVVSDDTEHPHGTVHQCLRCS